MTSPFQNLSDEDKRLNIEGKILNILTDHGGERIVAGPKMEKLLKELTDNYLEMRKDGL